MTLDALRDSIDRGLGSSVRITQRRPNLVQLHVPAYMADDDQVSLFVRLEGEDALALTDLGFTRMRLSYTMDVTDAVDEQIARIVRRFGAELTDEGCIEVRTARAAVFGAVMALVQAESSVEAGIRAAAARRALEARFRDLLQEVLRQAFPDRVEFGFKAASDEAGDFAVDALIRGERTVAMMAVTNPLSAERSLGTRLHHGDEIEGQPVLWALAASNVDELPKRTRRRLLPHFLVQAPYFADDRDAFLKSLPGLVDPGRSARA